MSFLVSDRSCGRWERPLDPHRRGLIALTRAWRCWAAGQPSAGVSGRPLSAGIFHARFTHQNTQVQRVHVLRDPVMCQNQVFKTNLLFSSSDVP